MLLWHWDCGAYGGSKAFDSVQAEEDIYIRDVNTVKDILLRELPEDIKIIMAYSKIAPQGLEYKTIE